MPSRSGRAPGCSLHTPPPSPPSFDPVPSLFHAGPNDATLLLTPHRGSRLLQHLAVSEGTAAPGYTVILGSHQNGSFKIERNGIDRFFAPHKGCRLDPGGGFRAFWLAFDNGRIAVGVGSSPLGRGARLHAAARAGGGEPAVAAALEAPEPAEASGSSAAGGAEGAEGAPGAGADGAPGPPPPPTSRRLSAPSPGALEALSPGPSLSSSPTAAAPAPPAAAPRAAVDDSPQDIFDDSDVEGFPADLEEEVAGEFDDVALALDVAAGGCRVAQRDEASLWGRPAREGATLPRTDAESSRGPPAEPGDASGGGYDLVGGKVDAAGSAPNGGEPCAISPAIAAPLSLPRAPPLPPLPPASLPPSAFTLRAPSSSASASARRAPLPAGLAHAWVDPSPVPGVRLVALSTWDAHVAYRRVRSFRGAELDAALESCRRTWDLLERVGEDRLVGAQHGERWRRDAAARPGPGQGRDAPRAPRAGAGPGPGTGPPSGRETPSRRAGLPGLALPSPTHPLAFGAHATSPLRGAGARGPLSPSPGPLWARRSPSPRGGGASPALGGSPPGSPPPGATGAGWGGMPGGWSRASSSGAASPGGAPLWAWRGGAGEWGLATPPALALASPRPPSRGLSRAGSYAALLAGAGAAEWGRGGGRGARTSAASADERATWEERDAADRLGLRSDLPDGTALAARGEGRGGEVEGDEGRAAVGVGWGEEGRAAAGAGWRGDAAVASTPPLGIDGAEPLQLSEGGLGLPTAAQAVGGPVGVAASSSPAFVGPVRAAPSTLPPSPGAVAAAFAPSLFSTSALLASRSLFASPRPAASPTLASARGRPSRPRLDSRCGSRAPPPLFFLAFRAALSAVERSPQDTLYSLLASDLLGPAGPKLRERAARAAAARPGELVREALRLSERDREEREEGEGGAERVGNLSTPDAAAVGAPLRPPLSSLEPPPQPGATPAPLPGSPLLAALGAGSMALVLGDLDSRAPERDFLRLLETWAVSRAWDLGISIWRRADAADDAVLSPRAPSHILSSPPPLFFLRQLWRLLLLVRFPLLSRAELRRARESPLAAICPGLVEALVREAEDADGGRAGTRVAKSAAAGGTRPGRQRAEMGAGGAEAPIAGVFETVRDSAGTDGRDATCVAGMMGAPGASRVPGTAERASSSACAQSDRASASSPLAAADLPSASSTLRGGPSMPGSTCSASAAAPAATSPAAAPPAATPSAAAPPAAAQAASGPLPLWRRRATPRRGPGSIALPFLHCHDGGGVLGYIGSAGRTRVWVNPVVAGAVGAWASSPASRGCDPRALAGRAALVRNVAAPGPGDSPAFWAIDLGAGRSLAVARYSLRADKSGEAPTAWVLQGCVGDGRRARADSRGEEEEEGEDEEEEQGETEEAREAGHDGVGAREVGATTGEGPLSSPSPPAPSSGSSPLPPPSAPLFGRAAPATAAVSSVASFSPAQAPQPRWVTLARVTSDASLRASPGAAGSWAVPPRAASRRFRSFRVVLPRDPPRDARGKAVTHLALSGLELYGALYVDGGEGGGVE